ncbi:hypothetical protein BaRGS_00032881 [Batillaria attramentaria]|uniref:Uncharacterized protein n=1 Tax=Batillaria attramentaria TaxID=370345 RepID=A0ABD0JMB7_9CAEN
MRALLGVFEVGVEADKRSSWGKVKNIIWIEDTIITAVTEPRLLPGALKLSRHNTHTTTVQFSVQRQCKDFAAESDGL